ncbi:MAG: GNAT family N-acetyltransferase [Desulfotignum sp.]|nr:GNAT family N-acetyltransferase [Desulfotignum sp.]
MDWKKKIVAPDKVMEKIRPGMRIFLGTGVSEPCTLVRHLMNSDHKGLVDLELIQLVNFSNTITLKTLDAHKYRLKTFSSGHMVNKAIEKGLVDLIPVRFNRLQRLFDSGRVQVDAAFVQISQPDRSGNASLGVSIDMARSAMKQASLVAGEINPQIPRTFGDTFVNMSEFDMLIYSRDDPIYFDRWEAGLVFDTIADRICSLIQDKSCIAFSIGPLFESLGRKLVHKRHLGIHSPVITDALMDLIKSGAVTNLHKAVFQGKSIASYAFGTKDLMAWLDRNHLVDLLEIQTVFNPVIIGKNPNFIAVLPVRQVDLSGRIVIHKGQSRIISGPMELMDSLAGAQISRGGHIIFGLPSRNQLQQPNIKLSVEQECHQMGFEESIDMVVTEYGTAMLTGLSIRERALALIEIAHPDDRLDLFNAAKNKKILYPDQIFARDISALYPGEIHDQHIFKNDLRVRFRPIKPSDEEQMRRLFYKFSDEAIYYRYFHTITTMPHAKMQEYVNVDWRHTLSIVGLVGEPGEGVIIAEARYLCGPSGNDAEIALIVDENYSNHGIATHMVHFLIKLGKDRGVEFFTAEVLYSNRKIMNVFKKACPGLESHLTDRVFSVVMPLYNGGKKQHDG